MLITSATPRHYASQLKQKERRCNALMAEFGAPACEVFASPATGYRLRAEFRIWHDGEDLYYAMFDPGKPKTPVRVDHFDIAASRVQTAMPKLLEQLRATPILRRRLFQVEFLSTLSGQLLITLVYHGPLTESWDPPARRLARNLDAQLVGRSRKQKRVPGVDYVEERMCVEGREYQYRQYGQSFTQPNGYINARMLSWATQVAAQLDGDLLELYCGGGNFSIPMSRHFGRVLATEVSKPAIRAAAHNVAANGIQNLDLARLSAGEVGQALAGERRFYRLRNIQPLDRYRFGTIFVDPPRAGLDSATESLLHHFEHIIYFSCNPESLPATLRRLNDTHTVKRLALFDQFPYTSHMECGLWLSRQQGG